MGQGIALALQIAMNLFDRVTAIMSLIATAQKEGRDVTKEELDKLSSDTNDSLVQLQVDIDTARAKGL